MKSNTIEDLSRAFRIYDIRPNSRREACCVFFTKHLVKPKVALTKFLDIVRHVDAGDGAHSTDKSEAIQFLTASRFVCRALQKSAEEKILTDALAAFEQSGFATFDELDAEICMRSVKKKPKKSAVGGHGKSSPSPEVISECVSRLRESAYTNSEFENVLSDMIADLSAAGLKRVAREITGRSAQSLDLAKDAIVSWQKERMQVLHSSEGMKRALSA